jgi:hypothetical protein
MIRTFNFVAIFMVFGLFLAPWASAGDLTPEYLIGRWVIDDQNCSSPDSEYVEFRENATFESTRTGKAEIVGFWEFNEDILALHMVTSLAFFDDIHQSMADFQGQYHYFPGKLIIFNTEQNSFEAFGVIGNVIERTIAVRCQ